MTSSKLTLLNCPTGSAPEVDYNLHKNLKMLVFLFLCLNVMFLIPIHSLSRMEQTAPQDLCQRDFLFSCLSSLVFCSHWTLRNLALLLLLCQRLLIYVRFGHAGAGTAPLFYFIFFASTKLNCSNKHTTSVDDIIKTTKQNSAVGSWLV